MRPPLPADVAKLGYADSVRWRVSEGEERYRRGLYILAQRTVPYPMLATFDCPDGSRTIVRRDRSNTPLQALTMANDPMVLEIARGLARRVMTAPAESGRDRLRLAFRWCVARPIEERELLILAGFFGRQLEAFRARPMDAARVAPAEVFGQLDPARAAAWTAVARVLLNLDEFLTRP